MALSLLCVDSSGAATTWLGGFDEEQIVGGLELATAFACASDGRVFVAEKEGRIREVTASGRLLPTPFAVVSFNTQRDRGVSVEAQHQLDNSVMQENQSREFTW